MGSATTVRISYLVSGGTAPSCRLVATTVRGTRASTGMQVKAYVTTVRTDRCGIPSTTSVTIVQARGSGMPPIRLAHAITATSST